MKFELSLLQVWALGSNQMKVFFEGGYEWGSVVCAVLVGALFLTALFLFLD